MASKKPKRRRAAKTNPMVVAMAWFDAAEWERLREVSVDAETLESSHAEWQKLAERSVTEFGQNGVVVRRVPVRVDALIAWCNSQNRPIDASARAALAAEMAQIAEL